MTKSKRTKQALILSVLSMLMCAAMLVGSTFAWFTDSASTGVNTIQSGTLDIDIQNEDGESLQGETLSFVKAESAENEAVLWEPNCTYALESFKIINKGNLALKYKIAVNGVDGDSELLDVIQFTYSEENNEDFDISSEGHLSAGASTGLITMKGHMDEDAGNQYQGKSLSGISITVIAAQDAVEHDSYDNTYDAGAVYPAATAADALTALKNVESGDTVSLTASIELDSALTIPSGVTLDGNGNTIISNAPIYTSQNSTVRNIVFETPDNANDNASCLYSSGLDGKIVIDGCTFTDTQWDAVQITPVDGAEIIINNCTFANPTVKGHRFIHIEATETDGSCTAKVTITNNKFGSSANLTESLIDIDYIDYKNNITAYGNVFEDSSIPAGYIFICKTYPGDVMSDAGAYAFLAKTK